VLQQGGVLGARRFALGPVGDGGPATAGRQRGAPLGGDGESGAAPAGEADGVDEAQQPVAVRPPRRQPPPVAVLVAAQRLGLGAVEARAVVGGVDGDGVQQPRPPGGPARRTPQVLRGRDAHRVARPGVAA
jgi:hypothetical protein